MSSESYALYRKENKDTALFPKKEGDGVIIHYVKLHNNQKRTIQFTTNLRACEWINIHWPRIGQQDTVITSIKTHMDINFYNENLQFLDKPIEEETIGPELASPKDFYD